MDERPSYRPALWGDTWPPMARWAKDRPRRVIAYYAAAVVALAVLLADSVLTGGLAWVIGSALALVGILLDAAVHVPRATRAIREARAR